MTTDTNAALSATLDIAESLAKAGRVDEANELVNRVLDVLMERAPRGPLAAPRPTTGRLS